MFQSPIARQGPRALKLYHLVGFCKIYYSHFIFEVITFLRKIQNHLEKLSNFQKLEGKTATLKFWNQKFEGKTTTLKFWAQKMEGKTTTPKNCVLTEFLHSKNGRKNHYSQKLCFDRIFVWKKYNFPSGLLTYTILNFAQEWLLNVKQSNEAVLFTFFIFCLSLNKQTENQITGCRKPYIVPNFAWKGLSVLIEKGVLYSQLFVECTNCVHIASTNLMHKPFKRSFWYECVLMIPKKEMHILKVSKFQNELMKPSFSSKLWTKYSKEFCSVTQFCEKYNVDGQKMARKGCM